MKTNRPILIIGVGNTHVKVLARDKERHVPGGGYSNLLEDGGPE
jgi:hypothetical protein